MGGSSSGNFMSSWFSVWLKHIHLRGCAIVISPSSSSHARRGHGRCIGDATDKAEHYRGAEDADAEEMAAEILYYLFYILYP